MPTIMKLRLAPVIRRLRELGVDGVTYLGTNASKSITPESKIHKTRITSPRMLVAYVGQISHRLSQEKRPSAQFLMLLNFSRSFTNEDSFRTSRVHLSYVRDIDSSNFFLFEVTDRETGLVAANFSIHLV